MEQTMAGKADKAAALIRDGGQKAKAATVKLYILAKDPVMHAKAGELVADGNRVIRQKQAPKSKRPTAR